MKRIALNLVVCIFLGGVTTVAVAWGCALWSDPADQHYESLEVPAQLTAVWNERPINPELKTPRLHWFLRAFGVRDHYLQADLFSVDEGVGVSATLRVKQTGWPLPAVQALCWNEQPPDALQEKLSRPTGERVYRSAILIPTDRVPGVVPDTDGARLLPTAPVRIGMIANTLFYAVGWAVLLIGPGTTRTLRRYHCGRCPRCAEELGGNYVYGCPRCGWRSKRIAA